LKEIGPSLLEFTVEQKKQQKNKGDKKQQKSRRLASLRRQKRIKLEKDRLLRKARHVKVSAKGFAERELKAWAGTDPFKQRAAREVMAKS